MPSRSLPSRPNLDPAQDPGRRVASFSSRRRTFRRSPHRRASSADERPAAAGGPRHAAGAGRRAIGDRARVRLRQLGAAQAPRRDGGPGREFKPHPRFDDAVAALDAGDLERLRRLIESDPTLVHARTNLEPPYHYFTGATLLHHVAGNPDRGRLAGRLARCRSTSSRSPRLMLDSGADVNATTLGPNGGTTMGLLITSKQASDAGVSGPLMDLLLNRGATLDLKKPGALDASLANHAPRAAERMIELGAKVDILAAAALGRMDLLRAAFDDEGTIAVAPAPAWPDDDRARCDRAGDALRLRPRATRRRRLPAREGRQLEHDRRQQRHGAAPRRVGRRPRHGPAPRGEGRRRVATVTIRSPATPMSMGPPRQPGRPSVQWMREHCAVDLHDAVAFDLRDQAEARIREDRSSVNEPADDSQLSWSTPLHRAAVLNREEMAKLLLAKARRSQHPGRQRPHSARSRRAIGADVIAKLIAEQGGKRAAELVQSPG